MKTLRYSLRSLKMLIKKYPIYLLVQAFSLLFGLVLTVIPVWTIRDVVNAFTTYGDSISSVSEFFDVIGYRILVYVAIEILAILLSLVVDFIVSYIERGFYAYVATTLYKKLSSIDYDFHESSNFLDNYTRALENGNSYIYNTATGQVNLIKIFVQSLSMFAIIFTINYLAIIYALIVGVCYYFIRRKVSKTEYKLRSVLMPATRKRNYIGRVMYVKDSMADIKTTPISDVLLDYHKEQGDVVLGLTKTHVRKRTFIQSVGAIIMNTIYPVILGIVAYFVLKTKNLGDLASLTLAASTISNLISRFGDQLTSIQDTAMEARVSFELLDMQGHIEGVKRQEVDGKFKELKIDDIEFGYIEEKMILKNISFYVKKGEKIAIVGENGAGKTTLVKLLLRLYDVGSGKIMYNGTPYTDITPESLRKYVGAVFQQPEVYSVSVAENVLLRKCVSKEDEDLVIEALKFADLYDYVETLEEGIHTMVTREFNHLGVVFSGGQTQKLAVARGYAQNYEVFILDEPSSALDPIAEAKMYHNMLELGRNKTLIFISHRLSAAVNVDRIYLFEEGRIAEMGTHEELMQIENGIYREMFESQSEKYLKGSNNA